jgi:hypothetical protein
MRVFKTRAFGRWAAGERVTDTALCEAVGELAAGLVEADLGGQVFKKRIGLNGRGKRGGARTLIAFRAGDRAVFLYGFAKNERDNINPTELKALRLLAKQLFGYTDVALGKALHSKELIEVTCEEQNS